MGAIIMADIQNEIQALSGTEYSIIGAALFNKLTMYSRDLLFDYQSLDDDGHVGLMTTPGGKYLSRDIIGGYTAQLPIQIMYRTKAQTNKELLSAEALITDIAAYLETKPYPDLDGGRVITQILIDGIPYRAQADNSASVVFALTGFVKYEK
jgi:hypothetical protein